MIKTVIIDDEFKARETIEELLKLYCNNVMVVAQADSVETGVKAINQHKPDLILLDVNMNDGSGFDLLKQFDNIFFKIIFITAYQEHAIRAFKFSALDYILKPIDPNELIEAINKVKVPKNTAQNDGTNLRLNAFLTNIEHVTKEAKKLVLRDAESIHVVDIKDIVRCESERNYTRFYFIDRTNVLISINLGEFDEMLNKYGFLRIHKTHLINLQHILRFDKAEGGSVTMKDNSSVPVSSRKREELLKLFDNL